MLYSKKLSKETQIKHCFFNRLGGKSKGIYKSLNCGRGSLDNKKHINKNIAIACKKISRSYKKLILLNQIHSNKFFLIQNFKFSKKKLIGDALITDQKKIIIGILTADCAPVLIFDNKLKIISAIHAGWKGAYKGIIQKVIKEFKKRGSESKNLIAAVGPCISQKNYEIQNDFKKKFLKQSKKNKFFFKKIKNKTYFSLNKYIVSQLKEFGVKKIDIIDQDTYNQKNNFFSARRSLHKNQDDYGRNISLIMIN
tara:strand:+ start:1757 stop:2515 length:759 start_codon:yes stop_codon:yes gene_type:complete